VNGHMTDALFWIIDILVGVVMWLFKVALSDHKESDNEKHAMINEEIRRVRDRVDELYRRGLDGR